MKTGTIHRYDVFTLFVKTSNEVIEDFGLDYLEDYGLDIPIDLINRYKQNKKEFDVIQQELRKLYDEQNR